MIEIFWSDKLKLEWDRKFKDFVQKMANRLLQGHPRYGAPHASQLYFNRLKLESEAYEKSGNAEHLYNIANYAVLESIAPQHSKHHLDNGVGSVTRLRKRIF